MNDDGPSPLAIASLVCGILAILGNGCCCIPIVNYVAPFLVVVLEVLGLVFGIVAKINTDPEKGEPLALAGIAASVFAILMSLAYVLLTGGVIMAYVVAMIALVASGQ